MSNLKPELPYSASSLIRYFIVEEDAHNFRDLEGFQMRSLLAEISRDKKCFAYTCEFGLLDDLISDLLDREYNDTKAFSLIEEAFIETWYDDINSEFNNVRNAIMSERDEPEFDSSSYRNMNDGFVISSYSAKRGE